MNRKERERLVVWQGQTLQLQNARAGLRQVEMWEQLDGALRIKYGGRCLSFVPWTPPPKTRRVVQNNKVHKPTARQRISLPGSRPPRPIEPVRSRP